MFVIKGICAEAIRKALLGRTVLALFVIFFIMIGVRLYPRMVFTDWGRHPAVSFTYPGKRDLNAEIFARNTLSGIVSVPNRCAESVTKHFIINNWIFDGKQTFDNYYPFSKETAEFFCRSLRELGDSNMLMILERARFQVMVSDIDDKEAELLMSLGSGSNSNILILTLWRSSRNGAWKFKVRNEYENNFLWVIKDFLR